jgi:hypothetical protein
MVTVSISEITRMERWMQFSFQWLGATNATYLLKSAGGCAKSNISVQRSLLQPFQILSMANGIYKALNGIAQVGSPKNLL